MRRLAAAFSSSKRDKSVSSQSETQFTARRSFTNLSLSRRRNIKASVNTADLLPTVDSNPSTPQLSVGQSSASSTGSASLQTHDEPAFSSPRKIKGKSWIVWLGNKSGTIKRVEQATSETGCSLPPTSVRPHAADGLPLGIEIDLEASESDEEEEQEEGEGEEAAVYSNTIPHARQVLQDLTQISLERQYCSSPFVQRQTSPVYPRSCSSSRIFRKRGTMEVFLHKRHLLERLGDRSITGLPSIQAFEPLLDEVAPYKTDKVLGFSPGLRQWVTRPPFEERLCIWLPIDETFTCRAVSSAYAVAAIEFSEAIEILADLPSLPVSPPLSPSPVRSAPPKELPRSVDATSTSSNNSASYNKPGPQIMVSSPLRNDAAPFQPASPRPEDREVSATSPSSTTKRGVRFAEEDKEDSIPIGYVMRIKKQKEEKARFLREERERRQFEEERRKHEQERIRRDQERAEWEKERKVWEKEKRAIEEERKARLYAEQYTAARQRAEEQRNGIRVSGTSTPLRDRVGNVQESRRISRLPYDGPPSPRSQASESASPSPHTSSPSSSRPPSIAGPSVGNKAQNSGHSRPSSFYSNRTNSSEDIGSARRPAKDRSWSSPGRTGSASSLFLPPVPSLPTIFPTDMPLLPPNAPFMMMNAYPQPRSNQSRSPSSSSRHSTQRNSSTESMNVQSRSPSGSSPRTNYVSHSQAPSSSSTRRPNHQRRTSDDSNNFRQNHTSSHLQIRSSNSHQSLPRGRSHNATYNAPMAASPWTAMPSGTGAIPTAMPYSSNSDPRAAPKRRQTALT
ncbi:hypothetical protein E1B28_004269 [Marasmius oreades]|uniref:Uncharacterized protein n=1 Tax=Marasmius oreades TaxID=181124 RepID=A0A9P7UY78_9AGAR|nr:uncharacterized protein E1B28_004269 [Marasmius oreades]KAG7096861.1 hypothetical protein E1B28_004269 [Marasmius oreades]